MDTRLLSDIQRLNPWFTEPDKLAEQLASYWHRDQEAFLLDPEWDAFWTLLIGPRRAGKTTLGKYLAQQVLIDQRFDQLLYINYDYPSTREHLTVPGAVLDLVETLQLKKPIIFLDEAQQLPNPGLLLKALVDLQLPYKWIASGSSQLEIKSRVQEHLTGREIESIVLPLSLQEIPTTISLEDTLLFGCYPNVLQFKNREHVLAELYSRYIEKDIVSILQLKQPLVLEKLMVLIAHASGQLINYQQLANDCKISIPTVQNYLDVLEKSYVIHKLYPFVGNKRSEITSNPVYYFIDNGFRNQALRNFNALPLRSDLGLLVEGLVFQEILKYKVQHFQHFDIHYWRTKTQAEVDFVLHKNSEKILPIDVKYRNLTKPTIPRAFRSFLSAYQPNTGVIITKDFTGQQQVDNTLVKFIPLSQLHLLIETIREVL